MNRRLRLLSAGVLALFAGACSQQELNTINPFADKTPPPPCPSLNVLADAANLTRFRPGPGEDLTDVLFEARMANIGMACEHDIDEDTRDGRLEMSVQLFLEADRGPADRSRKAQLPYFVSLTDSDRTPLVKEVFDVVVDFPGNRTRVAAMDEPVEIDIPLKAGQTGRDFKIWVGFQLTREELAYNRRQRALTGR